MALRKATHNSRGHLRDGPRRPDRAFARQLKAWRKAAGLSQTELERRADLSRGVVGHYEGGGRYILPSDAVAALLDGPLGLEPGTVRLAAARAREPELVKAVTTPLLQQIAQLQAELEALRTRATP